MAADQDTPIQMLKDQIAAFSREREWDQFHSPKNLTMALAAEVGELLELFQWKTEEASWEVRKDLEAVGRVEEEVADIAIFLLNLCSRLEIDLASAVTEKLRVNAVKYPVDLAKGKATKYTDLR